MPYANPEDKKAWANRYFNSDTGKAAHCKATSNYRQRNPEKYKATNAVNNALRDGKMIRPESCENCGTSCKPHGHHDDYSKPLDVRWLCADCHSEWHNHNVPT